MTRLIEIKLEKRGATCVAELFPRRVEAAARGRRERHPVTRVQLGEHVKQASQVGHRAGHRTGVRQGAERARRPGRHASERRLETRQAAERTEHSARADAGDASPTP